MALRHAPPAEASLINHLWPLLIVLFSALLPGERLRWWHLAGAVAGLAGTALLVTDGGRLTFKGEFAFGYGLAVGCALTWAAYSLLSRRLAHVPTDAVGAFCAVTAVLALICHLAFETTFWPRGSQWLVVLALGLGPVGIAFFAWDVGVKHGNIRVLGAASYAAPLLATALLVVFGHATATWTLAAAAVLIVGGAALAASDMLRSKSPPA
jgi:drug/metabolite transporter (DMT)-like permease